MEISSSKIENPALSEQGKQRLAWTSHNMPILAQIRETFSQTKPFDGLRIGICLHVEPKTAIWVQTLMAGGAHVSITGSPRTTKDDTAAALVADGVNVYAWNSETFDDHLDNIGQVLSDEPNLIADNGGDLHAFIHEKPEHQHLQKTIIGATEETTSGATRLREEIGTFYCPTLVINDTRAKRIIENRYGVGHGVVDALMRSTRLLMSGKCTTVIGYGYCGQGVAKYMRGVGAHVTVVDIDPLAQLEAHVEGFQTATLEDALTNADIVITVTGRNSALGVPQFEQMKDGALVCNAGHFEFELDLAGLKSITTDSQQIEANIDQLTLNNGKKIFLLGQGNLINLAAADGNPIEVMDLGLALQSLSLAYHVEHPNTLTHEPQNLPYEIEKKVAELALKAWI
jgi:adenosylhomocysteinase